MSLTSNMASGGQVPGGQVVIRFPHMSIEMSCDNETEMAAVVEMLAQALKIHETNEAKAMLIRSVEKETQAAKKAQQASVVSKYLRDNSVLTSPPIPTWPNAEQPSIEDLLKYTTSR